MINSWFTIVLILSLALNVVFLGLMISKTKKENLCLCRGIAGERSECVTPQKRIDSYNAGHTEYSVQRKGPQLSMPYDNLL